MYVAKQQQEHTMARTIRTARYNKKMENIKAETEKKNTYRLTPSWEKTDLRVLQITKDNGQGLQVQADLVLDGFSTDVSFHLFYEYLMHGDEITRMQCRHCVCLLLRDGGFASLAKKICQWRNMNKKRLRNIICSYSFARRTPSEDTDRVVRFNAD